MVALALSVGMCVAAGVEWSSGLPMGWALLLLVLALVQFKTSSRETEQLLQSVLELSSDYFCLYQKSTLQLSSQSLQTLFNDWGNEEFWKCHLSAEDYRNFDQAMKDAIDGKNTEVKVQLLHRPGALVSLSPLLEACQGTQVPAELSFRRIAWLEQPAVLVRLHICSARTHAVQDFAKTLNHELRTPLNIIIGTCDLVLKEHSSTQTKRRVHLARECASTFLATLSSLVQQCELRWGLTAPLHVPFVPARVVAIVVSASEKKLQEHGNHVEVAASGLPDLLWGSAAQLKQALSLLLRSCSILVRDQLVALYLSAKVSEHRCELRGSLSARNAPSLESDYQSALHLFSLPFVDECEDWTERLEKIESKALLHLAVAREMCRLLLGDLEVKTAEGGLLWEFTLCFSTCKEVMLKRKEGLFPDLEEMRLEQKDSFRMPEESLPSSSPSPASTPNQHPLEKIRRRRKSIPDFAASFSTWTHLAVPQASTRSLQLPLHAGDSPPSSACFRDLPMVLVADDVPSNSLILQEMLRRLNVTAETVSNGAEAVAQTQLWEPALIFMDCEMPVMDGLEATRLLRSMGVSVPIIGVTANGPEKEAECLEAGMSHFMCKPVSYRRLEALVNSLL